MMRTLYEIQTARLLLTPISVDDKNFIIELLNTEGWLQFIGDRNVHSEEDAENYIKKIIANPDLQYWVVRDKEHSSSVGIITFIKRDYLEHYDIGFAFLLEFSNRGFAAEATKAIMDLVIKHGDISILLAVTKPNNEKSIRLLEKLGFTVLKETVVKAESLLVYQFEK